ncbi:MAG: hypothetical protein Q7R81_04640 [Candidatus Peregrinibacteria bacterium]|nr:hypothetical protein [Candidatus Peregrinibacteria bacterium]
MFAHVDADSFFASVLQRKLPHLKGKPLLALGMGGGCVIAASYEAKAKGVRTGMRLTEALKLVPSAECMPADFRETGIASHDIEAILQNACPIIEQMSVDEWYLDLATVVGGLPKDLYAWAQDVQKTILGRTALSVSIGVAPSKLLAKMAGEYHKPAGISIICGDPRKDARFARLYKDPPSQIYDIETFLRDRPVAAIPGIGHRRQVYTRTLRWDTAWDFATADRALVKKLFGKVGEEMQRELLGERVSPVMEDTRPPQSISRCRSFRASRDRGTLWAHMLHHLSYTVLKMRRQALACRGMSLWLRDGEYEHEGSSLSFSQPLATEEALHPHLLRCFEEVYDRRRAYTQTGLALWNLCPTSAMQFTLFREPREMEKEEKVQQSLDTLHERFGRDAIARGSALEVKSGTRRDFDFGIYGDT